MADIKISQLPSANLPLDGTEVLPIVQSTTTKKVTIANVTAGRALTATELTLTLTPLAPTSGGTGTATAFTAGSLVFAGASGVYTQNNSRFFWDNTNYRLGINTATPAVSLAISNTDAILVPVGTTGERPTGAKGYIRYNDTTSSFEGHNGTAWGSIGGGSPGGSNTQIQYNSSGSFAGSGNLTFDGTNVALAGTLAMGSSFLRNRIINGDMRIDQRNAGASGTSAAYTVDRWVYGASQSSKGTWQQNAGSVTPPAGFSNYWGFTSSSSYTVGASDYFRIMQVIEGFNLSDLAFGSANAKTITLSFWVRSSLTGTFGGCLQNGSVNRSYPFTYTISSANTWEQKTVTVAGDTTGTWATDNTAGMQVQFGLGVGSTYNGTAGSWAAANYVSATGATSVVGTNGATFYITGVQLEVGSVATPFERRQYGQELALCQRYYETVSVGTIGAASTNMASSGRYAVVKRAVPTLTRSGNWNTGNEAGTLVTINEAAQFQLYNPTTNAVAVGGVYTSSAEL